MPKWFLVTNNSPFIADGEALNQVQSLTAFGAVVDQYDFGFRGIFFEAE